MNKINISISEMTSEDLNNLKSDLIASFDDFWSYDVLENDFLSDSSKYIVAKLDNQIVGFAVIKLILDEAELMNIVVKKDFRGYGIGSLLLNEIFNICAKFNIATINLEVSENNVSAIRLYQKFGFSKVGYRKNYYGSNVGAVLMSQKMRSTVKVNVPFGNIYFHW